MESTISKAAFVTWIALAVFCDATRGVCAAPRGSIKLNKDAFAFAAQRINEGQVVADGKGAWSKHRPSSDEENEFIRVHGFGEYAKWHLGIDERFGANTKQRYKFPYGDFKNVHRCGLLAVRSRARQYGYIEIENAAAGLQRQVKISHGLTRIVTDLHRICLNR